MSWQCSSEDDDSHCTNYKALHIKTILAKIRVDETCNFKSNIKINAYEMK